MSSKLARPIAPSLLHSKRAFAALFLSGLLGCSSTDGPAGEPESFPDAAPADLAAACGVGWVEECDRAGCDPSDAAWQDCRINGWSGYVAPAACAVETGYPGDERAPCAPDPSDGFQLHFGPSDYSDPGAMEKHVVQPGNGDFDIQCVYLPLPNTDERFLGQMVGRVRQGVHHTQLRFVDDHATTTSSGSEFCLPFGGEFLHMGQSREFQVPDLGVPNPTPAQTTAGGLDFQGSALQLSPGRVLALELHYINATSEPLLREAWINFYYQKPERVDAVLHGIQLIGTGISVPPRSTGVVRRACEAPTGRWATASPR
jgi:hypothetical protein